MMGKRSEFKRRKNDAYMTWDTRAVIPLLSHVNPLTTFIDPCAGDGSLIDQLHSHNILCILAGDINPQRKDVLKLDALTLPYSTTVITNPPWTRVLLHPMIEYFIEHAPEVWLLFDADWCYTKQEKLAKRTGCKTTPELLENCHSIVSVGRLKWIKDSLHDAKDNCAWYGFRKGKQETRFYGRMNE